MSRIVVAMSGGVDSSVAAHLLCRQGHDVIGVFMRHGEASEARCSTTSDKRFPASLPIVSSRLDHKQGCCSAADAEDARRIADRLAIPFYAIDFQEEFSRIMDYFVAEYSAARTPNPCIVCNNWLKFGKLFEFADSLGAQYVATGHYARLHGLGFGVQALGPENHAPESTEPRSANHGRDPRTATISRACTASDSAPRLLRGHDHAKDQSYVLFGIDRRYLSRMLLPIGLHRKEQIRTMAREIGLQVADKRDSQEICFVTSGDHAAFVRRRRLEKDAQEPDLAGEIVTSDGTVVGRHEGIEAYTIGQRRGLGVALGQPAYVVRIEADTRRVVIGSREELARDRFTAARSNWLIDEPKESFRCSIQIRYNSPAALATVTPKEAGRFDVALDEPRFGIAPGQAAVCYLGDRVLGGGWIE